jgi:tripartite-type tricarboxylate transporter receptor subunit TctC
MGARLHVGRRRLCAAIAGLVSMALWRHPAWSASTDELYKGATLRFIVGSGAGGGYDSYARLLAPHLSRALDATVVVDNRPGAGGLVALNQTYTADPDGLTIMIANASGAALAQLLGQDGVHFDLHRLEWLAGLGGEEPIIMWSAQSPLRTLADGLAATEPVKWAASGRTSSQGVWIALAAHALHIQSTLIVGYKGSNEAALAAMRGEVDGIIVTASSARIYAQDGKLLPVAALGKARSPLFPDVPTVAESVDLTPDQAWWFDFSNRFTEIGRAIVTSPGVSPERVAFLADAFRKLLTDPGIIGESAAAGRSIAYTPPDIVKRSAFGLLDGVDAARLAELRKMFAEGTD